MKAPLPVPPLRCSVYIAVSVDGFIARPDGALDWLSRVETPGEDYGYAEFSSSVDALVMGRNTYDTALGFPEWPYSGKRVLVLSHRPAESRQGEEFFQGTPEELVRKLAAEGVRHAYVDGGSVIRQFLECRLISDLTLSVIPVLLGSGIPLFGQGSPEQSLELVNTRSFASGLTQLRYALRTTPHL